jgi:hypothetical protein
MEASLPAGGTRILENRRQDCAGEHVSCPGISGPSVGSSDAHLTSPQEIHTGSGTYGQQEEKPNVTKAIPPRGP